jgi:hypothetical protein
MPMANNSNILADKIKTMPAEISPVKISSSTLGTGQNSGHPQSEVGWPRKTDKLMGTHTSPKILRLSDDARDGMELMHQMTCAIQAVSHIKRP